MSNKLYTDPLGNVSDTSFNNMQNYFKNKNTINAQVDDFKKKYKSNEIQLIMWSSSAAIGILIVLVLIRNIRE
jgi:S-adenosylmethionine synthetase|tara:strand:- start:613 stop:831 length:219 start_codon:yes stop_codon:yes gene_type:complete